MFKTILFCSKDVSTGLRTVAVLYLRLLGVVYFIAFSSLLFQTYLISENGVIPLADFAYDAWETNGFIAPFRYPSVFWISTADVMLWFVLGVGTLLSLAEIFLRPRLWIFASTWFLYLSLVNFGGDFLSFPWDTYLLENGVLAVFLIYFLYKENKIPFVLLFAFQLLFFRQWASMALVKLLWSDPAWHDLTFMDLYWRNQPMPAPFSWYMAQLSQPIQMLIALLTLILEITIPIAMLCGKKGRVIAFYISLCLSVTIHLSGNFGFFNILTIVSGLWCLQDLNLPKRLCTQLFFLTRNEIGNIISGFSYTAIFMIVFFQLFYLLLQFDKREVAPVNAWNYYFPKQDLTNSSLLFKAFVYTGNLFSSWRLVSPHGVFKMLPHKKYDFQFEITDDEKTWSILEVSGKSNESNLLMWSPYQPRLAYVLFYQAQGAEILLRSNAMPNHINNEKEHFMTTLVRALYTGNKEVYKNIKYGSTNISKVKQLRITINEMSFISFNEYINQYQHLKNKAVDTLYIRSPIYTWEASKKHQFILSKTKLHEPD